MTILSESLVLARSRASDLENVRKLNCWGNKLVDIKIIRKLKNVQVVSLSVNKISTLEDFSYCQNLEELYIRKNNISNLAEICHLRKLPKLRILWLSDNPCAVGSRYRMTVLRMLPNLHKLDNVAVQEEELNEAIEQGLELSLESEADGETSKNGNASESKDEVDKAEKTDTEMKSQTVENGQGRLIKVEVHDKVEEPEDSHSDKDTHINAATLSLEETNKIREQLGLKALPLNKITPPRTQPFRDSKARNANVLQAALCLVKELDQKSLDILQEAVKNRLEILS